MDAADSMPFSTGQLPSPPEAPKLRKISSNSTLGDEEKECTVCGETFLYKNFAEHKKTEKHRTAFEQLKKFKKKNKCVVTPRSHMASFSLSAITETVDELQVEEGKVLAKQKYWIRTGKDVNIDQNETYVNTLVVFLALRYCLVSLDNNDVKISINNSQWGEFGDVVLEVVDKEQEVVEIHAFQVKQTQYRRQIPLTTITAEKGKFSLKKQCDIFNCLKRKKNYDKTNFTLLTVSDFLADENTKFTYDESMVAEWKVKANKIKEQWINREVVIAKYKKPHLANTTDDSDNICIFKILNHEDPDLDVDLGKFMFFVNQKKVEELRQMIRKTIEEIFVSRLNITNDLVKSTGDYFRKDVKNHYKLSKQQFFLKIPELILAPHFHFPDSLYTPKNLESWNQTIRKFDVVIVTNQKDTINKLYACLNHILQKAGCSSLIIQKENLKSEALKFEIFDGFEDESSRNISLSCLYTCLWKSGLAPLVVQAETENDLIKISSVISFLKTHNLPLKFILATNLQIDRCTFPQNLKTMMSLQDLAKEDNNFFRGILRQIKIPIVGITVSLQEIVRYNQDFVGRISPQCLLNMFYGDFSFKNVAVPMTEDLIDNTFVVSDEVLLEVKKRVEEGTDSENVTKNLEYVVNIKGNPTRVVVPADI